MVTKKPPIHKSKHIFLCDISGSCEWATTWFFSLLTGCHESFDKIIVDETDKKPKIVILCVENLEDAEKALKYFMFYFIFLDYS